MAAEITPGSRLRYAELLSIAGVEFWDLPEYPEILARPDDLSHTVAANERLESIAYRYYRSPTLWWVIALVNGVDLPQAIREQQVLRIPSPAFVRQMLAVGT